MKHEPIEMVCAHVPHNEIAFDFACCNMTDLFYETLQRKDSEHCMFLVNLYKILGNLLFVVNFFS